MITITNFNQLAAMVRQRSAIQLDWSKQYLVVDRLTPLLSQNKLGNLDDLVNRLRHSPSDPLMDEVVDSLTTNETSFFRDPRVYRVLESKVLPKLLHDEAETNRPIQIWSAACSSGQEPYTLAMMIHSISPAAAERVTITASDISANMLDRGRKGLYSDLEVRRGLSESHRNRYFQLQDEMWSVCPELKRMVTWHQFSLNQHWPLPCQFDLILMRNVLVYFDEDSKRKILERSKQQLKEDGLLLLGGAEASPLPREFFSVQQSDGVTLYRNEVMGKSN